MCFKCLQNLITSVWSLNHHLSHLEIMAFSVLHKLILQTRMRSHPMGLDVWFLVGPFVYFHTSCVWTAKSLARLCGCECTGSPEPSLVAYVVGTIISWAQSDQSSLSAWRKLKSLANHWAHSKDSDWADAQADLSLRWAHSHFVGFVMSRLKCDFLSWFD